MTKAIDTTKRSYLVVSGSGGRIAHIERRASSPGDGLVLCSRPMVAGDFEEWDEQTQGRPERVCKQCREIERRQALKQADADTDFGYDPSEIPATGCATCKELIGDEPFVLDIIFARFGMMLVYHERCCAPADVEQLRRKEQLARERRQKQRGSA